MRPSPDPADGDFRPTARLVACANLEVAEDPNAEPEATTILHWPRQELREPSVQVLGREQKQVVLGGPGTGKSSLFHYAMLTFATRYRTKSKVPNALRHNPIPLLVELRRDTLRNSPGIVEFLVTQARDDYGVEIDRDDLVSALSQERRAIVMFDGLDEILDPEERAQTIGQFEEFALRFRPNWSCHPESLDTTPSDFKLGGFSPHYTCSTSASPRSATSCLRWYRYYTIEGEERDAVGLIRRVSESPRLLDLGGNPLLLTMMAVIYKHHEMPEKRWELYRKCSRCCWRLGGHAQEHSGMSGSRRTST